MYGMGMWAGHKCEVPSCPNFSWTVGPGDKKYRCDKHRAIREEQLTRVIDVPEEVKRHLVPPRY